MSRVVKMFLCLCSVTALPGRSAADEQAVPAEGLVLWLDAESVEGPDGTPVHRWQDGSGRSNHVGQSAVKHQPILRRSAIGGRPAIEFRGQELLECARFQGFAPNDQPFHIVIVFRAPNGGPASQRLLDLPSRTADTSKPQSGFWVGFQERRRIPRLGITGGDEGEAQTPLWDSQPHVLELVYRADQRFEIHVDGRTERQATFGGRRFLGFQKHVSLAIGQHYRNAGHAPTFLIGEIAEILIYQRGLSDTERFELGTLLTDKYSLKTQYHPLPKFERDVLPILAAHCLDCHGREQQQAGLDLRTVTAMLTGGEAGPVVVRGHPEFSELIAVLTSGRMPPDDAAPLQARQIDMLKKWIAADAPADEKVFIRTPQPKVTDQDRQHWAWKRPRKTNPPVVQQTQAVQNEIDRFILAGLEKRGWSFSVQARPERLMRRLYFDLHGLPPEPDELDAFLEDTSPLRMMTVVERLLASHHFGERWGRYWLDVAGYVDVYGNDNDAAIIKPLAGKWRYRDYVIQSFNQDKPLDRFLMEQLAGDQLSDWQHAEQFSAETRDDLTATAFLLSANDSTSEAELNTPDMRHHVLQRTAENVANTLFAFTLQCCRCHDHKYEAVSQIDYYRFQAIFSRVFNVRDWVQADQRTRADVAESRQTAIDAANSRIEHQVKSFTKRLDQIKEAGNNQQQQAERAEIEAQIAGLMQQKLSYGTIPLATDSGSAATTHVLRRGDYLRPGLEVRPALFEVLLPPVQKSGQTDDRPSTDVESGSGISRRLDLARAVTDPDSLAGQHVARVYVNRVWQQLFGQGLVTTSDNLGQSGAKPSHPELLDWLTLQFIEEGWRTKPLIRRMVLSAAYRQTAALPESLPTGAKGPAMADPENRLLWRMNLRRLDSEQIRDAMLTVSGQLDRTPGGPPIPLEPRPDGSVVIKHSALPPGTTVSRRSVYLLARRNYQLTFMRIFDQPIVARNCAVRSPSAVVTQSLALLHSDFVVGQATEFAARVIRESSDQTAESWVRTAWRVACGRTPGKEEMKMCVELLARHTRHFAEQSSADDRRKADSGLAGSPRRKSLTRLCHMLLNTSEFLYVP